jgi:hypothetical protein
VHAVLLSGAAPWGLDAAGGVMRWLDEQGIGLAVGPARVPIVPGAVLFDLPLGDHRNRPDAAAGYAACQAASARPRRKATWVPGPAPWWARSSACSGDEGRDRLGFDHGRRRDRGRARACNALATCSIRTPAACWPARAAPMAASCSMRAAPCCAARRRSHDRGHQHHHRRDRHRCGDHQGAGGAAGDRRPRRLARAINPAHTLFDGDTLFALGTGESGRSPGMMTLATWRRGLRAGRGARRARRPRPAHRALHLPRCGEIG